MAIFINVANDQLPAVNLVVLEHCDLAGCAKPIKNQILSIEYNECWRNLNAMSWKEILDTSKDKLTCNDLLWVIAWLCCVDWGACAENTKRKSNWSFPL